MGNSINAPLDEVCCNEDCTNLKGERTVLRWKCSFDRGCGGYNDNLKANDITGQPNFQMRCHNIVDQQLNDEGEVVPVFCHEPRPGSWKHAKRLREIEALEGMMGGSNNPACFPN